MISSKKVLISLFILLGLYLFLYTTAVTNKCINCDGLRLNTSQSEYCDRRQPAYSVMLSKE
jgi:hypothetical protein